jgi:RNA polymerase sigma-70 factor (ECF subfamily)
MPSIAELFDANHRSLFRYLVRLRGDPDVAEDAIQETFMRLIEKPPRRKLERAWLFTVARNAALEHLRTRSRRERVLAAQSGRAPIADPPSDPHETLEAHERQQAVLSALTVLSTKERTAVLMREEGFSHREIATAVGTTTGSVGTLIARALLRLSSVLSAEAHPETTACPETQ